MSVIDSTPNCYPPFAGLRHHRPPGMGTAAEGGWKTRSIKGRSPCTARIKPPAQSWRA